MIDFNVISLSALAVSLVCSALYVGHYQLRAVTRARALVKTAATGSLVVASLAGGVSTLFAVALGLSALSDYAKSFRTEPTLRAAVIASAAMQILICVWFVRELWVGIEAPLVGILGVLGIAGGFLALVWPRLSGRAWIVLPMFACSLALFALGLGATPERPLLMLGLMLYLLSLLLLGAELILFHGHFRMLMIVGPVIWICYYCGLLLMMIGGAS